MKNTIKILVLSLGILLIATNVFSHEISESDQQKMLEADYFQYIELGASHMLTGYDHLLFLFGVIFFLTKFKDILILITAFTIGHSITLIFATLYGIQANYFLIDAVIALTVCYKGFDNLNGFKKYFRSKAPNILMMVFIFGLIHGFGLSTRLQELPLGALFNQELVLKILSFNVGVEFGQIIALSIMLFILSGWRKTVSFSHFSKASNVALILAGLFLFIFQIHGYTHSKYSEEFPLNKDEHYHIHEHEEEENYSNIINVR